MAKELVNPIERHIEKGIVGIAGLILIGAIAQYVVTSPNKLELGGETVTPSTIDGKLAQRASDVRMRIRNFQTKVDPVDPLENDFTSSLAPFERDQIKLTLPTAVAFLPDVPLIDRTEVLEGEAKLPEVVQLSAPRVTHGRSTLRLVNNAGDTFIATNWVTVSAIFDTREQMRRQQLQFGAGLAKVLYAPLNIQRRSLRSDGTWSDDDWKDIESWPSASRLFPSTPAIQITGEGSKAKLSSLDARAVENFEDALSTPRVQVEVIRPEMIPTDNGDAWEFPIFTDYRDVLQQDDEFLFPNEPPSNNPLDRYASDAAQTKLEQLTPAQIRDKKIEEAKALMKRGFKNLNLDEILMANNLVVEVIDDPDASKSEKDKAKKFLVKVTDAENTVRFKMRRGGNKAGPAIGGDETPTRTPLPKQQLWCHDAKPGSVIGGETYQYRMRARLLNRMAGDPGMFANKQDASVVLLAGAWSEPTQPITIERDTAFFAVSPDERNERIGIEMFRWYEGEWVKTGRVKFGLGDALRHEARTPIRNPDDPATSIRIQVPYEADATIVDIDFNRSYRNRKESKRGEGSGVKFASPSTTCSVVLVDSHGRLHERFVPMDKSHPDKKTLDAIRYSPKKGR